MSRTARIPGRAPATLLEVGCGTGVSAVMAALSGYAQVTALDVDEHAVGNTRPWGTPAATPCGTAWTTG